MTDFAQFVETATYCRVNDVKRPGLVGLPDSTTQQICPEDRSKPAVTDGTAEGIPTAWYVRVVFDELLDPNVEDLIPELDGMGNPTGVTLGSLARTQPVTLTCEGANVPYDGYYSPNGNSVSYPVGPGLFIQALDPTSVKTGSSCQVSILPTVKNKRGQGLSGMSSFNFKIAPMKVLASAPDLTDEGVDTGAFEQDPAAPVNVFFSASIATPPAAADVHIFAGANGAGDTPNAAVCGGGGTPVAAIPDIDPDDDTVLDIAADTGDPMVAWAPGTTYRLQFTPTAQVTAVQGSVGANEGKFPSDLTLCFHTPAM